MFLMPQKLGIGFRHHSVSHDPPGGCLWLDSMEVQVVVPSLPLGLQKPIKVLCLCGLEGLHLPDAIIF